MYGITFNVDFEAEILEIDFGQFAFFHRGETKISQTMDITQQIHLLKRMETKFPMFGWSRSDKLWNRVDEENHFKYYDLKLKKTVFLWDDLNIRDFANKIKSFMTGFKGLCIEKSHNTIKYVFDDLN